MNKTKEEILHDIKSNVGPINFNTALKAMQQFADQEVEKIGSAAKEFFEKKKAQQEIFSLKNKLSGCEKALQEKNAKHKEDMDEKILSFGRFTNNFCFSYDSEDHVWFDRKDNTLSEKQILKLFKSWYNSYLINKASKKS